MTDDRLIRRLRAANPAQSEPKQDSELFTSIVATPGDPRLNSSTRSRGAYSWRYVIPAGGAVVAAGAVAAIAFVVLPGGAAVTPTSAVGAVLHRAASAAQAAPPTTLGAGQYFYSDVHELATAFFAFGSNDPAETAYTDQEQTRQTWIGADGSANQVWTYDGPQQFVTPASRAGWLLAGSPPIAPETNTPGGQYDESSRPGSFTVPDDLSKLPTDPAALAQLIDTGNTGLSEIAFDTHEPVTPAYTFIMAAQILATPALGSDPALRAALYAVMANVPGIELLGSATDHSGRTGTAIAGPPGDPTGGFGWPGGGNAVRNEVIIDPSDGSVLEINQVIAEPSQETPSFAKYLGDTAGQVLEWTDYLAAGVVNSTTATIPASGATGASGTTSATGVSGTTDATGETAATGNSG